MVGPTRAADTWGVSGPDFLLWYAGLAGVLWLLTAVLGVWFRGRATGAAQQHRDIGRRLDAAEAAYLRGGPRAAVLSALAALRARRLVQAPTKRRLQTTKTTVPGSVSPLERAVHEAIRHDVPYRRLHRAPRVRKRLSGIDARLTRMGVLLKGPRRTVLRLLWLGMAATAGVGVARLVAGVAGDQPVGFLVLILLAFGAALAWLALTARRRLTRNAAGDQVLGWLTNRHQTLHPARRPSWDASSATSAAMSVAVFGAAAVAASDPSFAARLDLSTDAFAAGGGGAWSYPGGGGLGAGDYGFGGGGGGFGGGGGDGGGV